MSTKLVNFINDNGLNFSDSGSGLNSDCTIISGYALHLGITSPRTIVKAIKKANPSARKFTAELKRVFEYAEENNYGYWWDSDAAKLMYKF